MLLAFLVHFISPPLCMQVDSDRSVPQIAVYCTYIRSLTFLLNAILGAFPHFFNLFTMIFNGNMLLSLHLFIFLYDDCSGIFTILL